MDTVSKETRSQIMAKVRSRGNKSTERRLKGSLAGSGISGYKLNVKELPGVPDFVFPNEKIAIFVDGCFWHGCPSCYRRPHTSRKYWDMKVQKNMARDSKNRALLKEMGWLPLRVWEHDLKDLPKVKRIILTLIEHQQTVTAP